jgi:signal transduction histidine kinase
VHTQPHFTRRKPEWWPENEPWPPATPWRAGRNHFFRRLGCLFGSLFGLFFGSILVTAGLLANQLGIVAIPPQTFRWGLPLALVVLVVIFGVISWAGRGLRRMTKPFGALLAASDRLAEGDYSARVPESGPLEVRSVARAFNSMADRLEAADTQRRALLADVTHELRTPLTVIQGNVEGMLDGVYAADEEHLRAVLEESHILARLVEDLRTLALAESGALQLNKEPVDLAALIRDTLAVFQPRAASGEVTLSSAVSGDVPTLNLDPLRLGQVFSNLIANALRYTPPGGWIKIEAELRGERRVAVVVADSGAGIPPEELANLFERFNKARDSGGMGLGLAIARKLVEAHGGTISAESEVGQGTRIQISLPLPE